VDQVKDGHGKDVAPGSLFAVSRETLFLSVLENINPNPRLGIAVLAILMDRGWEQTYRHQLTPCLFMVERHILHLPRRRWFRGELCDG
jgi:hypothetical protein